MMDYPSTKRMKKRKELDALVADKKKTLLKSSPGSSLPDRLLKSSLIKPMMIKTRGDHQLLRSQVCFLRSPGYNVELDNITL